MMINFLAGGTKQGAEERSSLLNKLLFSEYAGNKKVGGLTSEALNLCGSCFNPIDIANIN